MQVMCLKALLASIQTLADILMKTGTESEVYFQEKDVSTHSPREAKQFLESIIK